MYTMLQGGTGIPRLHWSGCEGDFKVLVMDLLGSNLNELMALCQKKLSVPTVLALADQAVMLNK